MISHRFQRNILVTRHALLRMVERGIDERMLLELIETGDAKHKDSQRLWLYKHFQDRDDNLLCAAVMLDDCLIVKTVMHHFELQ